MVRHWTWTFSAALALAAATSVTAQEATTEPPADPATETAAPAEEPATETPSADETTGPVMAVDLTCGAIAGLEDAHAAALVYYIAGYADATASAAEGVGAPPDNGMLGGLTLSAAAVIEACAADEGQLVSDAIQGLGGSMGERAAETLPPAEEPAPADDAMAPADEAPADDATSEEEPAAAPQ